MNGSFFERSETFIYRQVVGLGKKFNLVLAAFKFVNSNGFPLENIDRATIPARSILMNRVLSRSFRFFLRIRLPFGAYGEVFLRRLLRNKISLIHAHYGWTAVNVLSLAQRGNVPLVVSFHGKDASAALEARAYRDKLPELFDYASAIILCSNHMIETLALQRWLGKVHVVPYGIDTDEFQERAETAVYSKVRILHSGRLVAKKGVPDLIRVFLKLVEQNPSIELHIIGEGPEESECRALVPDTLFASVFFYGSLPIREVRSFMQKSDVFVLNSRTDDSGNMEGLPNALLEAMSCGLSVVSTRHAGIPMAVVDGVTGLLVAERDNDELYNALEMLCSNIAFRRQLGKNARAKVMSEFSIAKMELGLQDVFESVLNKQASQSTGQFLRFGKRAT
ncbi:glycosyltransferase [Chryseolinea sp. T2]|uniref:glycosyltransferase n=1 Tax=Chryseolinea sp. T2 TaxID=3129255 RepID=UPI003076912A